MASADSTGTRCSPESGSLDLARELADLEQMTVGDLRDRYAELWGESTNSRHRTWLIRRIVWRLQANLYGDISARAREMARQLARDADIRSVPPRTPTKETPAEGTSSTPRPDQRVPPPGSVIVRDYKGRRLTVTVLTNGFELEGEIYRSLSAVAKKVTGQHCNGYFFFRLGPRGGNQ